MGCIHRNDGENVIREEPVGNQLKENTSGLLVVEVSLNFDDYTIYGDFREREVTSVVDGVGTEVYNSNEGIIEVPVKDVRPLEKYINAVMRLLSPRVNSVEIS